MQRLERRIANVYKEAQGDLRETIDAYFDRFKERDKEMMSLIGTIQNGKEWTEEDYKQWRLNQIARGKRFEALRDQITERYTKANETAISYVNDDTPSIYSLNRNYAAYTIEQVAGDVGFTLWDESTVRRLIAEEPDLMPYYPPEKAVKRGIDLAWGKKQITASVTSSILQGRSIKGIVDDLQTRIPEMNRTSAIRAARTAVTGAQNAGRMDSYVSAERMGIKLRKEWLATLDNRTRHAHAVLDGQKADIDKPFKVDGQEIRYPGDPTAAGYLVYNCRCTLIADVDNVDTSDAKRWARNPETGRPMKIENMTYAQWAGWKSAGSGGHSAPGIPEQAGEVDFSDERAVLRRLSEAEKELSSLDYEVNYSITTDGKVWRVSGEAGTVNPSAIPSSLRGSYSYHNHPERKTNYSFSADDVAFFFNSEEAVSIASDDLFVYVMRRTKNTVDAKPEEVYHRFEEIFRSEVRAMQWEGTIDPDIDTYHEVMRILSRELGFEYERRKKGK